MSSAGVLAGCRVDVPSGGLLTLKTPTLYARGCSACQVTLQIHAAQASHPGRIARVMFCARSSLAAMRCALLKPALWGMPFLSALLHIADCNHSS